MKFTIQARKEIEITHVRITIPIRDDDDRKKLHVNELWTAMIDIKTGQIENWDRRNGAAVICEKVRDEGEYALLTNGEVISKFADYPPNMLLPRCGSDYVELNIDATGKILNWRERPSVADFFDDEAS